jgi:hypothetical protein
VANVNGILVADLNGGKAREMGGHGCHPRTPPLAVMVPLGEGACDALVDEPHGCMTHLVGQRTPQLGVGIKHPGAQLNLDLSHSRPMDGPASGGQKAAVPGDLQPIGADRLS